MQTKTFNTYSVIDLNIVETTLATAMAEVSRMAKQGVGGYACFVNAHVSVMAKHDRALKKAVNEASFAFPDGMPVYLVGRYLLGKNNHKISGPDFMQQMFENKDLRKLNHYFYGGTKEVIELLVSELKQKYPDCNIVGAESPPFRALSEDEELQALTRMINAEAQLIWVGLGAPKQELWMQKNTGKLKKSVLLGVGAAFDFHSGSLERAPVIMQKIGLEWLYRFLQEPGRLWKRYLVTNSLFLFYIFIDTIKRLFMKGSSE